MIGRIRGFVAEHRNAVLFLAALTCGAVAVLAGHRYLAGQLEAERARLAPKPPRLIDVVVARRDLGKGEAIGADSMALRRIPQEYVPSSAIQPPQFDGYVGMRLAHPLRSGEPLVASAIVGGDNLAFSSRVKPGIRALTIAVDEINSISGMLQPGDRIDLLFSARPPDGGRAQPLEATVPLFQNLLVLATGRQVRAGVDDRGGQRAFSSVTVEVEPEHAQRLVVAQRAGKLTAVLRNPDDHARFARRAIDIRQLLDLPAPAIAAAWQGPQIIVGGVGRVAAVASPGPVSPGSVSPGPISPGPVSPGPMPSTSRSAAAVSASDAAGPQAFIGTVSEPAHATRPR
ncbi:MAG: Flp pilus assembly protein CpaB [Lautropia sp.]